MPTIETLGINVILGSLIRLDTEGQWNRLAAVDALIIPRWAAADYSDPGGRWL